MAKNKNKPPKAGSGIAAAVVPAVEAESTTSGGASSSQQQESDPLLDGEEEEEEELELLQLDLGDMIKMKQVLDESVAGALLENQHLPEDYIWDNWKLAIMFMACCFAMMAQFTPIPFPESRPVLGICGSLYFVLSGVLQLMATLVDRDAILWTRPVVVGVKDDATDNNKKFKNKDLMKYGLKVRSDMPRFSEYYTVIIEFQVPKGEMKSGDPAKPPRCVQQKWSVGQFFDKEGYFDEVGLTMEIDKLFERFDQGKYDTMDASNKAKKE